MKVRRLARYEGEVKSKSDKFYAVFADHTGVIRKLPLFDDRKASDEAGRKIDRLVDLRAANDTPDAELTRWIETTTTFIRERLASYGIIATTKLAASRPLSGHLDDWKAALLAKGNTKRHAELVTGRARKAFDGCGFVFWSDLSASKLQSGLAEKREDRKSGEKVKRGIGAQTFNFYLQAVKQFCTWMVRDGRANHSPLAHLQGLNVKTDRRHDRRAFSVEEFRWFLAITDKGAERFKMAGADRALLYRLAVETGFRRGELASLTRESFDLEGNDPGVNVSAKAAKARRQRRSPLRAELVAELKEHLKRKMPGAVAFNVPTDDASAKVIRADLAAARAKWLLSFKSAEERAEREKSNFLRYEDDAGRFLDFHALRHTRGVWLFEHYKAHPREVQELMGVSSLALVDRYTRSYRLTDSSLAKRGPDLSSPPEANAVRATGTENAAPTAPIPVSPAVSPAGGIP